MSWTSVTDALPEEGEECVLCCMRKDGSFIEVVGYRANGEWIVEGDGSETEGLRVRSWMPLRAMQKLLG